MKRTIVCYGEPDRGVAAVATAAGALAEVMDLTVERRDAGVDDDVKASNDDARVAVVALPYERGSCPAAEAVDGVTKPLLLVPHGRGVRHPTTIRRVLLPLDGTREAAEAVADIGGWCASRGVDVVVLHVFDARKPPMFWDQPAHAVESFGQEFLARHWDPMCAARIELRAGEPAERIGDVADAEGADLVALGWFGDLSAGRARAVKATLASALVPVLLLPIRRGHSPLPP